MTERLLVVGGDAAGMSAAAQARRRRKDPGELEIVAFERGRFTSYAACGIPYLVGDLVPAAERLVTRSPEEHRRRGVDVRLRHEVTSIDTGRRSVTVRDLDAGEERDEPYDHLVVATGARPLRPPLPGIDADGVFGVQTLASGIAVRDAVDRLGAHDDADTRRAVVVGAGYIGLEMAEALVRRGFEVAVVEASPAPMGTLDPDMGGLVADAMRATGIDLHLGEKADHFEVDGSGHVSAVVTEASTLPAGIVVLGLGVRPDGALAAAAGIGVGDSGGITVDDHQRTSAEGVYAAGDCVEVFHRVSRRAAAIALGTHANKQGRVVGINATGGDAVFPGVVGTAVTQICELQVARTGLGEKEAADAGFDAEGVSIEASSRAHYYPGGAEIHVKLVVEKGTGRLLGGQIVGREGAAKRIDVVAAALWNEMTVEEVMSMDLSYAPPFSPVWDPVQIAARAAVSRLGLE